MFEGRIPPHNADAEISVLGSILLSNDSFEHAAEILRAEDFYMEKHRRLFAAFIELRKQNMPIDMITLPDYLRKRDQLEDVGGIAYLVGLSDGVPTSMFSGFYAEIVAESARLRRVIASSAATMQRAYDEADSAMAIAASASKTLETACGNFTEVNAVTFTDVFNELGKERKWGLKTGFYDLDEATNGLADGQLITIGGASSMGKTAFALNMAANIAVSGNGVVIFSLEMPEVELRQRMLSMEARVELKRIRESTLAAKDWERLADAVSVLESAPIHIVDDATLTLDQIWARTRALQSQQGIKCVFVDYLQIMSMPNASVRREAVQDVSRGLKVMARKLGIPVVLLSQLSREVDKRPNHRPLMSDLRESGSIEQDSDMVLFVFRNEYYEPNNADTLGMAEILIAKQRNGKRFFTPKDSIKLVWNESLTRFDNMARGRA